MADDPDAIKLGISTFDGVETDTIDLQQAFQFRGNVAVSQLVVTQHGSIHLDPSQRTAEEGPLPIQAANGNNAAIKGPRIQVAQTSFTISNVGKAGVYYKDLGSALLVSWEPALVAGGRMLAQFQVSLEYATGDVNMQWKGLGPIGDTIPVSVGIIQDDSSQLQQQQLVSPATGAPFGNQGVAQYPSVFSQDTCRKFRVVKSAAAKPDEEPTVVRGRHLR